jgi:hypothetical protein
MEKPFGSSLLIRSRKTVVVCLFVAFAVTFLVSPMFAQNANGRIGGSVKDQTGGTIAGATVVVTDTARGLARSLTTDEAGAYSAPNLIPGTYSVRATYTGFQAWERTNIKLEVSQDLDIDVVLQPGAQTQTVTVTEELPIVNTSSATLGGTLSNESINDLPISGRNYQNLLELRPGVVLQLGNNSDGGGPAATNGLRAEASNQYQIEGLAGMDPYTGQSVVNNIGVNGDAASLLPVDAIQEFNQQFNPKASCGFKAGSSVSVGLKSGTNALHGTAYGFFRNSAMDAKNYYTPVGVDINSNARQYGATVGGRIKKDKLFFFAGYEEMNLTVGSPTSVQAFFTDPGMLNCSGVNATYNCTPKAGLFPNIAGGNLVPDASNDLTLACLAIKNGGGTLSPQSLSMTGLDQFCQMPGGTSGSGLAFGPGKVNPDFFVDHGANDHGAQAPGNQSITTMFPNNDTTVTALGSLAKLDYQLNAKNSINGFFYRGFGERFDGLGAQPSNRYRTDFLQYPMMVGGTWTYLVSSSFINSVRIGYASLNQPNYSLDEEQGFTAGQLGLNTGVTRAGQLGLPQAITPTGFYTIGGRESDFQGPGRSTEYTEQISYLRGQHAFMFGGTLIVDHQDAAINAFGKGSFVFGSAASGTQSASGLVALLVGTNQVPCLAPGTLNGAGVCSNGFVTTGSTIANNSGLQTAQLLYGDPSATMRRKNYSAFVQDDWRIKPRLTLNLGLRYDISTILRTDGLDFSTFDPNLAGGLAQEGNQIPALYQPDHNNFSPRLGIAWDVRGNGKTVFRAGSSIIYELLTLRSYFEVGNALGLAGNPTSWITGCSTTPLGATAATAVIGANGTNCPGTLVTPGGNRNVGTILWQASSGTIVSNGSGGNSVLWDRATPAATTIFPGNASLNCSPSIFTQDTPGALPRAGATCPVGSVNSNLVSPYVETWTASVQQALRNNLVLEVAYVGNHGVKSLDKINLNQPLPGAGWTPALIAACNQQMITSACTKPSTLLGTTLRPYANKFPWLGDVTNTGNYDTSSYNGLQVTLTARNYHGLFLVSGYTWSHALSYADANNGGFGVDAYNHALDFGNSTQDIRHRFTASPSYSLPGMKGFHGILQGWKVNGNFKAQSGRPVTFTSTTDFQGTGRGTSRWNIFGDPGDFTTDFASNVGLVRDPKLAQFYPGCAVSAVTDPSANCSGAGELPAGINPRTGAAYVLADLAVNNPTCMASATKYNSLPTMRSSGCWVEGGSALTPPAVGTFGNAQKGSFHGLPYWDLDASITKRQAITERFSAEFRAELYNVFNHPAFGQPTAAIGGCTTSSCTFQTITNTPDVAATNPILGQGGPRRIQFGIKILF